MLNTAHYPEIKEYQAPTFKALDAYDVKQSKIDAKIMEMKSKIQQGDISAIVAVVEFYGSTVLAQAFQNIYRQQPAIDTQCEAQIRSIINAALPLEARRRVELYERAANKEKCLISHE